MHGRVDVLTTTFPLETKVTETTGHSIGPNSTLYRVHPNRSSQLKKYKSELYLVDSIPGGEIACHPSLVGQELKQKSLQSANAFTESLRSLGLLDEKSGILHILRGAVGYMVHEALPRYPVLYVRTEYNSESYRDHTGSNEALEVTYRDYQASVNPSTLIIPDTFATGRSAEVALLDLIEHGIKPETLILYGFLAVPGIKRLSTLCSEQDIELISFAICDITPLAYNDYDMPLYGLDESIYTAKGEIQLLGSIVAPETLDRLSSSYVAGMDQPGDWSERHDKLYNGTTSEQGNIASHLKKSQGLIEKLDEINSTQTWYNLIHRENAQRELQALRERLREYQ
jgi:hypothetical protein